MQLPSCPDQKTLHVPASRHGLHFPPLQYGVGAAQTLPQAPQLTGSKFTGVHVPWQSMAPEPQS
jgi:hypothetical protein